MGELAGDWRLSALMMKTPTTENPIRGATAPRPPSEELPKPSCRELAAYSAATTLMGLKCALHFYQGCARRGFVVHLPGLSRGSEYFVSYLWHTAGVTFESSVRRHDALHARGSRSIPFSCLTVLLLEWWVLLRFGKMS